MSPVSLDPPQKLPPLGVGRILKEALSILSGNIGTISVLGFVPLLLLALIQFLLAIYDYAPESDPVTFFENGTIVWADIVAFAFVNTCAVAVYGGLVKFIYDVKLGNPADIRGSVAAVFRVFVPLTICDFLATLVALFALMALILPGLYLMALWCLLTHNIVIESAGFQSFNRSAFLTRNYRWACVALVAFLLLLNVGKEVGMNSQLNYLLTSNSSLDTSIFIIVDAFLNCALITFSAALFTLIYLRLRDIKEGTAWLADVFD